MQLAITQNFASIGGIGAILKDTNEHKASHSGYGGKKIEDMDAD